MTSSGNANRIAKNTIILYLRSLFVLLISLYTSRVVLRTLGVVDYGIYNVVGGVISALSFLNWSLQGTYQRYFNVEMASHNKSSIASLFKTANSIQLMLSCLLLLLAETVGLWFVNAKLVIPEGRLIAANWVYQVAVLSSILTIISAPYGAIITAYERMDLFAYVSILGAVLRLGIVLLLSVLPYDRLITYSFLLLLVAIIDWAVYVFFARKNFSECSFKLSKDVSQIKSVTSFSGWVVVDSLAQMLKGQGLNIVLNLFFGPIVNSARGIAYQVLNMVNQFISSFQTSFRPQLTKSYSEGNMAYMRKLYYTSSKISYFLIFTISMPIIIEVEYILRIWLGDGVPDHTAAFTRIILITTFISAFSNPTSCIAYASGKIKTLTIIVSSIMLSIVPLAYLFLKFGGAPEVAMLVSLVVSLLAQFVRLYLLNRIVDIEVPSYLKKVVLPSLLCTFIIPLIAFIPRILLSVSFFRLVLSTIVSVGISCLCIWLLGLDKDERVFIKSKVTHFINKKNG